MNVNVSKTKEYYHSLTEASMCDCGYCRRYRLQVKSAYPKVAEYLISLGIDIEKPFETSTLEPDENGMLEYCCCQYIAFGNCEPEYHCRIDNVEIRVATSYPSTCIEQEHFVIELFPIKLKFDEEMLIERCIDILHEKDQRCVLTSVLDTGYPLASVNRTTGGSGIKRIYFVLHNTSAIVTSFENNPKGSVTFYSGDNSVHLIGEVSVISSETLCKDKTDMHFWENIGANNVLLKFIAHESHIYMGEEYHFLQIQGK